MPKGIYARKPRGPYKKKNSGVFKIKIKPPQERFWEKVNKQTGNDCWEWTGTLNKGGYGLFKINGKSIFTHRFSYELHKDPIPSGMCILHSCDNRKCCQPNHLSVGTRAENCKDRNNKNRQAKGSSIANSVMTEEKVIQIKNDLNKGIKQIEIAKRYKIPYHIIYDIKRGKSWSHVNI